MQTLTAFSARYATYEHLLLLSQLPRGERMKLSSIIAPGIHIIARGQNKHIRQGIYVTYDESHDLPVVAKDLTI